MKKYVKMNRKNILKNTMCNTNSYVKNQSKYKNKIMNLSVFIMIVNYY